MMNQYVSKTIIQIKKKYAPSDFSTTVINISPVNGSLNMSLYSSWYLRPPISNDCIISLAI